MDGVVRQAIRAAGEVLLTVGLVGLLFIGHLVWGTGLRAAPADTAVLDPVPSHPRQRPTRRLISLITCDPAWTGTHRVIVTGVLVAAKPR